MFKNRKIIYLVISFIFIFIIFFAIILNLDKNDQEKVLILEKNYDISSNIDEIDYINVSVYISNKKSYVIDKNQLVNSYLKDNNDSSLELELLEIKDNENNIEYDELNYYEYLFKFKILFKTSVPIEWYFDDAYLNLNYNGNNSYELNIGHCSIIKYNSNNDHFSIKNLRPLLSNYKNNDYASGLLLGLSNNDSSLINIKQIELLNNIVNIGEGIKQLNEFPDSADFDSVAGYNFTEITRGKGEVDYNINPDETIFLFIPFYYNNLYVSTSFPVKISYMVNNIEYSYIINDFIYFVPSQEYFIKELIHIYNVL